MDAYGAFSDPAPSGFGGVPTTYAPPPSDPATPRVSRTMQYADPDVLLCERRWRRVRPLHHPMNHTLGEFKVRFRSRFGRGFGHGLRFSKTKSALESKSWISAARHSSVRQTVGVSNILFTARHDFYIGDLLCTTP
jgi:hypothetical protein